jgi:hypothetical protein
VKTQKSAHTYLVVCPSHSAQVSFAVRDDQHLADGRVDPVHQQLQRLTHTRSIDVQIAVASAVQKHCTAYTRHAAIIGF